MADKYQDATDEILILRQKLIEANEKLELVGGATLEAVYKMHDTMKRLLAANDINKNRMGYEQMRVNILENINDMGREVVTFYHNKGLIPFSHKDVWPPTSKPKYAS